MKHKEADASIIFRHWIMANPQYTQCIEMKDTNGKDYLPFSEVKQAQLDFADAIMNSPKGVLIRVQATVEGVPDYIYLRNEPCFIPIRYPQVIHIISVNNFIFEKEKSERKSLTEDRARAIATISIPLKRQSLPFERLQRG